jgi:hypothetical protein
LGKRELSADLFAGKYHRRNRGDNNRVCRDEEKEEKIAVIILFSRIVFVPLQMI